ncbi:MAG: hypothetical protein GY869_06505, partial [Planctomycetes bacterium]|nr:hypothetical protein [Planctomycetota bacterium]
TRAEVEGIRRKATLAPGDLQTVRIYITSQFRSMENANDATGLNKPLIELENASTSTSSNPQTRQQYLAEFAQIIKDNYDRLYQSGLNLSQQEAPEQKALGEDKKLAAATALVISGHPILIEDLKKLLNDESEMVRICSAKGFSQENMREQLTSADGGELTLILSSLDERLTVETSAEVIMYASVAAGMVDTAQSVELLKKCVARRVEQYKNWGVTRERADIEILRQVFKLANQKEEGNDRRVATELLRSATELYTAAYHRYRMGKAYPVDAKVVPLLTNESQQALKSLLIVIEKEFMQICGQPTNNVRTMAIYVSLQDASEAGLPGAFSSVMGSTGKVHTAFGIYTGWAEPGELPPPSAEIIEKAILLQKIKANRIKS